MTIFTTVRDRCIITPSCAPFPHQPRSLYKAGRNCNITTLNRSNVVAPGISGESSESHAISNTSQRWKETTLKLIGTRLQNAPRQIKMVFARLTLINARLCRHSNFHGRNPRKNQPPAVPNRVPMTPPLAHLAQIRSMPLLNLVLEQFVKQPSRTTPPTLPSTLSLSMV